MNFTNYFESSFNTTCILTDHSIQRLNQRFFSSELINLKFLIQASLKNTPLHQWNNNEKMILIDPHLYLSIICCYDHINKSITLISFIKGSTEKTYKNCKSISVSILKEKSEQEIIFINNNKQKFR